MNARVRKKKVNNKSKHSARKFEKMRKRKTERELYSRGGGQRELERLKERRKEKKQ